MPAAPEELTPWDVGMAMEELPKLQWQHGLRFRVSFSDSTRRLREELELEQAAARKLRGDPAPVDTSPAAAPSTAGWSLLQTLCQEVQTMCRTIENRNSAAAEVPGVAKPRSRPRRMMPAARSCEQAAGRPAAMMKPEISARRLYFSCPACRHRAVLPSGFAGGRCRCPRCSSPIVAPDPANKTAGRDLSRTIEPMLHPERFLECRDAHKRLPWLGVRVPKIHGILQAGGALVLSAGVILTLNALTKVKSPAAVSIEAQANTKRKAAAGSENSPPDALKSLAAAAPATAQPVALDTATLKERARTAVAAFLTADGPEAKAPYVRDPARVLPLMRTWYQHRPGGESAEVRSILVSGAGFYSNSRLGYPFSDVRAELTDGTEHVFTVEHLPEGDRIEWESSVGYSDTDWQNLVKEGGASGTHQLRVMAALDDYPNFRYGDPEVRAAHICVRLHDPLTMELLGYGYLPKTSPGAIDLHRHLATTLMRGNKSLRQVMLDVKAAPDSSRTRQVQIVRVVRTSWRDADAEDAPVTASIL